MSVKNFVQCGLVTPIAANTTELVLNAPAAPYDYPPLDGGTLVIADSVARPTFYEVISYTHRIDNVLYGVVRAKEGSTARAWTGTTWVYMALTAADYVAALLLKANLDSPALTGNPTAPTPAPGDNDTSLATTAFVQAAIAALVNSSPSTLDTLKELATSLGNDPNFATTMTNALAGKEPTLVAGTVAQFYRGDKTWQSILTAVQTTLLTGLGAGSNTAIVSTDTLIAALAKIQNQLDNKCASTDSRLSDAREWTATQVSQAEAEAGTATTDRKWTALRVAQAVRGNILTGLNLTVGTAVAATDTLLVAIGKLQKQITDIGTNLAGNVRATVLAGYVTGANAVLAATDTVEGAFGKVQGQLNAKANLASPALTGTPTAPTNAAPGNSSTQIATTAFVQSVVNGQLDKTGLTGGTLTLTADEAANAVISLAGTLTSNLIIEIPAATNRIFSVSNGTTGAFTVSIKVVGLAPTVLVAQGKRNLVYTNAVGAYDAITDFDAIALTGVCTAPTAAVGTNTTQLATTAYTVAEIGSRAPTKTGSGASGTWGIAISGNAASATTLTGLVATVAELNFVDGVTSAIQTQLNGKADSGHTHSQYITHDGTNTGWYRSTGTQGWFNATYGGGIYMTDSTFVRTYNGKGFVCDNELVVQGNTPKIRMQDSDYGSSRWLHCDGGLIGFLNSSGGWSMWSDNSGNLYAYGNVTAYSDIRLKTDIEAIPNALDKVLQLNGVTYTRIDSGERHTGLLAQDVQAVLPEAVIETATEEKYLSVAYGNLVGLLVESIKELNAKVDEQAKELALLRSL